MKGSEFINLKKLPRLIGKLNNVLFEKNSKLSTSTSSMTVPIQKMANAQVIIFCFHFQGRFQK